MSFLHFINLILKNLKWLLIIPTVLAVTIYYFTRNDKKVYSSESTVFTGLTSGYTLSGNIKSDYYSASNAFDNLLSLIQSRDTKQDVAIGLIAEHIMIKKHDPNVITYDAYKELKSTIPDDVRNQLLRPDLAATKAAVLKYMQKSDDNIIYRLLNSKNPYYSIEALNSIKSMRINNSDIIKISYETNDPFICQRTLELLEESFMRKFRLLKEGQTDSVVGYFEEQTKKAFLRLDSAERVFLEFNKQNDIINYYEQTKAVANEKEDLYALNHDLEMDELASSKSLEKVNESIKSRVYQSLYGTEILKDRDKLSDIYNKIALTESLGNTPDIKKQLDSLKRGAANLEKSLKSSLENLNSEINTPNGIPTKNVLDDWLKTTLAFEQSKAKLTVMDKRKKEFTEEYRKFAPLGALLKKIERQINVSEQEYLQLLHDLNMAKLSQQNTELTSKLNIVDPPYLPLKPNASKRIILIIAGFLVGFIFVLGFILAKALSNRTLLEPVRARKMLDMPGLGVYPLLNESRGFLEKANLRLIQRLLSKVDIQHTPIYIGFISTLEGEGKSTMLNLFEQELINLNYSVERQLLLPTIEYKQLGITMPFKLLEHQWGEELNSLDKWSDRTYHTPASNKDFVLVEFPALDKLVVKPRLFPPLQHTILVCRANRVWNKKDAEMVRVFASITGNDPMFILNGVETDFAEEYIGEVPKKRNSLRSLIKRMVKFEFGNRKTIR